MADTYNISLRMPQEMGETISKIAKDEKRVMNTVICMLLEKALKERMRKRKKVN